MDRVFRSDNLSAGGNQRIKTYDRPATLLVLCIMSVVLYVTSVLKIILLNAFERITVRNKSGFLPCILMLHRFLWKR